MAEMRKIGVLYSTSLGGRPVDVDFGALEKELGGSDEKLGFFGEVPDLLADGSEGRVSEVMEKHGLDGIVLAAGSERLLGERWPSLAPGVGREQVTFVNLLDHCASTHGDSAVRARKAFASAEARLVLREEGIIRLLAPPLHSWEKDPGYIRDYLPGVRENGGQYTHAAAWFVIAACKLRMKDKALELFQMINPIMHTRTPAGVEKYKGEPYVAAADVYDNEAARGSAGWTWYTGSAGWMMQAAVIHLLGLHIERGRLSISPCVPDDFGKYTITYRFGGAEYAITVEIRPGYQGKAWLTENGGARTKQLALCKQKGVHRIFACWQP